MIKKILTALKDGKMIVAGIYGLIITLAFVSAIWAWYGEHNKPPISNTVYVPVKEIKEVEKIKRVEIPGPERVVTIEKQVVVEKLKLPDWIKTDANKQVIATAEIEPFEGKTNAAAILDTKTGASEIIAKQIPLSFAAFENKKELGVRAGYRDMQLAELKVGIAEVDRKIENGLRKEVQETKAQMEKMTACVERRRKDKEVEDQRGVYGFFRRGLVQFRDRGSYIVVTSLIVGSAFIIIWVAAKVLIFHESSGIKVLKIFGVG